MKNTGNERINYDPENDVLYIRLSDSKNVYGDEDPTNMVIFRDLDTDSLTGVTIMDYMQMYRKRDDRLNTVPSMVNLAAINQQLGLHI